jgi:threonine dehydratase
MMSSIEPSDQLSYAAIARAHAASARIVRDTPLLTSASISERCGGTIALKAECLQRTGSFKLRGALNRLRAIGAEHSECLGVVAGSAGNHAQSLAYAAHRFGIPCEVFMPRHAAVSKLTAVRAFGAVIHQGGTSVDDCVSLAQERARETGLSFVHPFDDYDVIAGQGGVGIEIAEAVPDLKTVIVPVGGGGLASGIAAALAHCRPNVQIIGVQAANCPPIADSFQRGLVTASSYSQTIADGIAVKRPGALTLPLIERWLSDVVVVPEEAIAEAMVLLLERSKLVVEGAGAASLAALLSGIVSPASGGTTVAILSGGNVDIGLLASITARDETRAGRRTRLLTQIEDRPGGLARLLQCVADSDANIISVEHMRDGIGLPVRATGVALTIETAGHDHLRRVTRDIAAAGYTVTIHHNLSGVEIA